MPLMVLFVLLVEQIASLEKSYVDYISYFLWWKYWMTWLCVLYCPKKTKHKSVVFDHTLVWMGYDTLRTSRFINLNITKCKYCENTLFDKLLLILFSICGPQSHFAILDHLFFGGKLGGYAPLPSASAGATALRWSGLLMDDAWYS